VAKQGEYTVVVWLADKNEKLLGKKLTARLQPVGGIN